MPIKAKDMCQNCWHKYKRKNNFEFFLRTRYTEIYQRCTNKKRNCSHIYNGPDICTRDEFLSRFLRDKNFISLFKKWESSGWEYKLCPSIDRINVKLGYTLDNIQFITHSENATKDQEKTRVNVYKKNKLVYTFCSQGEAGRKLNLPQPNIWKCLVGLRKTCGGYSFKYARLQNS